jgi:Spy/CpxP family protein refolding chaperone
MTKRRWFGVAAATLWTAASVATFAAASPAAGDRARPVRRGEGRGTAVAEYLGLSEQQKASWRALHERQREEMKPLLEEGRALRQRLREAIEAREPDPTAVGQATLAMEAHRRALRERREAFHAQLVGLLDPAQKEKLHAFEAARRTLRPGRSERHPHPVDVRGPAGRARAATPVEG